MRAARSRANFSGSRGKLVTGSCSNGNQVSRFVVDYYFFDAPRGAGHDRCTAGHGLKINDAKRLVDRRAAEDARLL